MATLPAAHSLTFVTKKTMNKQSNQMAVRYKSIADGNNAALKSEDSLNKILSPGCYAVEVEHSNCDVGLPSCKRGRSTNVGYAFVII